MKIFTRTIFTLAAVLVMVGSSKGTAQTAPWSALPDGTLDPRFGDGGIAITTGTESSSGSVGAVLPNGKIVLARAGLTPLLEPFGELSRYNVDGSPDTSFGTAGIVTNATGGRGNLIVQPDGKLLTLARYSPEQLVRYNGDGTLDTSFGTGGLVTAPWSPDAITLAADGRIVVVGNVVIGTTSRIAVARYRADGSPDLAFGLNGNVTLTLPPVTTGRAVVVATQADGRIVLAGSGLGPTSLRDDFLVIRLNADGTLDSSFDTDGLAIREFDGRNDNATAVTVWPDGRILAGGRSGANRSEIPSDFALMQFLPDGSLDGTFGSGGKVRTRIPTRVPMDTTTGIARMALQSDGRIVAAGRVQPLADVPDMAIVRYDRNGMLDPTFGVGGIVVTDVGDRAENVYDMLIQPDQQIVIVGVAGGGGSFGCNCSGFPIMARYRSDTTRGVFGTATRPIPAHIEAEDYDLGGQGTGYYDTTAGNESGRFVYRTDDVDLKLSSGGGHAVGWFTAGEWLAYTIDVPRDGVYTVAARVGSALPGRTFHLAVDGTDVTGPIPVPNLGAWDTYTTARRRIPLTAGRHVLRVTMGPSDFMEFQSLDITEAGPGESRGGGDFDGDGRTDLMVFRPGSGGWYINNGSGGVGSFGWGLPGDVPLAGDFDGDGRSELTVWRPASGTWYIRESSSGYSEAEARVIQWGLPGDVPISGDFDGDGRSELTVFRPSSGMWYVRLSSRAYALADAVSYQWGLPGDLPLVADFDGDGQSELTVFRPSTGTWHLRYSSRAYAVAEAAAVQWGLPGDVPVAADFDGDGLSELTVFRPSGGLWYVRYSSRGYAVADATAAQWGLPGDVPISGDFDGDGRTDLTAYRPATGQWFVRASTLDYDPARAAVYQWGLPEDIPVQ